MHVFACVQADNDYLKAKAGALRRHAVAVGDALKVKLEQAKVGGGGR